MSKHFKLAFYVAAILAVSVPGTPLAYGQETAIASRALEGVGEAQTSQLIVSQVDTSKFPDVRIFASVIKNGQPVTGLTAADFKIREDEVEQEPITITPKLTPLSLVVTLDTSGSMSKALPAAKSAAGNFLQRMGAEDQIAAVGFARTVKSLSAFSPDKTVATSAIESTAARGDTALYDALFHSVELLKGREGRKAIVILSDGRDDDGTGKQLSTKSLTDVLAIAREVNVPIFTIGLGNDLDVPALQKIATESGGVYQEAPAAEDLQKLYDGIGKQLSGQYNLSYRSNLPGDGSVHRIQLSSGVAKSVKEYVSPGKNVVALKNTPAPAPTPAAQPVAPQNSPIQEVTYGLTFDQATPMTSNQMTLDKRDFNQWAIRYGSIIPKSGSRYMVFAQITGRQDKGSTYGQGTVLISNGRREEVVKMSNGNFYEPWETLADTFAGVEGATAPYYIGLRTLTPTYFAVYEYDVSDAGSGRDAGGEDATALTLPLDTPVVGHGGHNDYWDSYKVTVQPDQSYLIKVRPSLNASLTIKVVDDEGVSLGSSGSPNPGAITKHAFKTKASVVTIQVGKADFVADHSYGLVVGNESVASPAQPLEIRPPVLPSFRNK